MALFGNGRPNNWKTLQDRDLKDTIQYRDVYEEQQLKRAERGKVVSEKIGIVLSAALALVCVFLFWLLLSFLQGISDSLAVGSFGGDQWNHAMAPTVSKVILTLFFGIGVYALFYVLFMRIRKVQNALEDPSDINEYRNDQHIAFPEELQEKFDWFPDVGATSDVQFSSLISHMALSNKGLRHVEFTERATEDIIEDGEIVLYKGEKLIDEATGLPKTQTVPMLDIDFMNALYDASGIPKNTRKEKIRKFYDATKIKYNPDGSDRDKLGKFNTVADLINADWQLPDYEPQRPGGAYLVDTAPVV